MKSIQLVLPLILLILFGCARYSSGQRFLALGKPGKTIRYFHESDEIHIKLKDDKITLSGIITHITDSSIWLGNDNISIDRIDKVLDYEKRFRHRKLFKQSLVLATNVLLLNSLHRWVNTDDRPIIDNNTLVVAGILVAAGGILSLFKAKKYRMNYKRKLRVINGSFAQTN